MRIAFFTPLSPIRSALADFGEGLALAMAAVPEIAVDLFIDGGYQPSNTIISDRLSVRRYQEFESRREEYDACLYSMGDNAAYHGFMLDLIRRNPGFVILNDLTLHRCILQRALAEGEVQTYLDELWHANRIHDFRFVEKIQVGLADELILEYPLFERTVDSSIGVVVQNHFARDRILEKRPNAQVKCIPYPFFMPPECGEYDVQELRARQRAEMGLEDQFLVGSFGIFVPNKHLEACLSAFAHILQSHPQSRYLLGGAPVKDYDLEARVQEMGLERQVIVTGWMSVSQFAQTMSALDVGIHLRHPHIGGTPYTPIRLMGLGVGTIVSDIEPLAELPQGACLKIAPDEYQSDSLTALLTYLADNPDFRARVSANGRAFTERYHDVRDIAQQYIDWMAALA